MPRTPAALITLALAALSAHADVTNGSFEAPQNGALPSGWFIPTMMIEQGFAATTLDADDAPEGGRVVRLAFTGDTAPNQWGNLMQTIDATPYQGQRIELAARIRVDRESRNDRVQMWLRADRPGGKVGFFNNSAQSPARSPKWTDATIVADIEDDAASLALGFMVFGAADAFIDDVSIRILGDTNAGNIAPAPLEGRALDNVAAAVRLALAVRWFHPTTAARADDWDQFTIDLIDAAEGTATPAELALTLQQHLASRSRGVRVWAGPAMGAFQAPDLASADHIAGILHRGLGPNLDGYGNNNIYRSELIVEPRAQDRLPDTPAFSVLELPGGISAVVPHLLPAPNGVAPVPADIEPAAPALQRDEHWRPGVRDRTTRLASIGTAWGIFAHFYPYWDVIDTDWDAELKTALAAAAIAEDADAFQIALERLLAKAEDGHASAGFSGGSRAIPIDADLTSEGVLVVREHIDHPTLNPGDRIITLNGTPVMELIAERAGRISGSTEGFVNARALMAVLAGFEQPGVEASIQQPSGDRYTTTLATVTVGEYYRAAGTGSNHNHQNCDEIAPGVHYVDLNGLDWADLEPLLPELAAAEGVVFDLRGYPGSAGKQILHHLTDKPIHSAYWRVPVTTAPRLAGVTYDESRWNVMPLEPRIEGKVVFITGPRAISYAESCMAIVEAEDLGLIVGDTTAGTNGNINRFTLPTGQQVIWTGMRVVKHDGQTVHQGVGVAPDIRVTHTQAALAAGKDAPLERATELILDN